MIIALNEYVNILDRRPSAAPVLTFLCVIRCAVNPRLWRKAKITGSSSMTRMQLPEFTSLIWALHIMVGVYASWLQGSSRHPEAEEPCVSYSSRRAWSVMCCDGRPPLDEDATVSK